MQDQQTIKEIYHCSFHVPEENRCYPLPRWYEQLLNKHYDEIKVSDVTRMFRQNIFVALAVSKAIDFLNANPFSGELFEGEVLEALYKIEQCYLEKYSIDLRAILSKASVENEDYEWLLEEEREEFGKIVNSFVEKMGL